jgi:RNA polymerase sigma factor (sigma-70 family)
MRPVLARTRPDRAFERLYQRYAGDVYRYALAVMRNQPDAEDVTQTTFLNAYRAFRRGERPEKPQNWLIAIAHNVCRQRFRQSARRPTEVSFDDDIAHGFVVDEQPPTSEDIRRALGHLAFNQRAALVMRELEGRSYAEIAEILKLSTGAVETLIFRARRALREQLESSLTCGEAELAISRQLDGRLDRKEKGALRAHLRECEDCATFARRQRAQRTAFRSLAAVPLPASLSSFFGGSAAVGTGLAAKAAVAVTIGAVVGGTAYEGVHHAPWRAKKEATAAPPSVAVVRDAVAGAGIVPAPREHVPIIRDATVVAPHVEAPGHGKRGVPSAYSRGHTQSASSHGRGNARGKDRARRRSTRPTGITVPARRGHTKPVRSHPPVVLHVPRPSHPAGPTQTVRPSRPVAPPGQGKEKAAPPHQGGGSPPAGGGGDGKKK